MPIIIWEDRFSVGINRIDEQHKELLNIFNDLYDAMSEGKGGQVLGPLLDRLVSYTINHFATEERLMLDYSFPGYLEHKAEHDDLTAQVAIIQRQYKEGLIGLSIQVMKFLKDWLVSHMMESDQKYSAFFQSKGVS